MYTVYATNSSSTVDDSRVLLVLVVLHFVENACLESEYTQRIENIACIEGVLSERSFIHNTLLVYRTYCTHTCTLPFAAGQSWHARYTVSHEMCARPFFSDYFSTRCDSVKITTEIFILYS